MEKAQLLEFITERYNECEDATEREQISILYWVVADEVLESIRDLVF